MGRKRLYKNTLVQYKGGGYGGCFWEWNFFYFDSKGTFHNVASSGYRGIKEEKEAREYLAEYPVGTKAIIEGYREDAYIFNLKVKKEIKDFCENSAESLVVNVSNKVNTIEQKELLYWTCSECGDKIYPRDRDDFGKPYAWQGYKGNGGVGIISSGPVCYDCACSYSCGNCGEYAGPEGMDYGIDELEKELRGDAEKPSEEEIEKINENWSHCIYCAASKLEKMRKGE
jgi:hypothetical protein